MHVLINLGSHHDIPLSPKGQHQKAVQHDDYEALPEFKDALTRIPRYIAPNVVAQSNITALSYEIPLSVVNKVRCHA